LYGAYQAALAPADQLGVQTDVVAYGPLAKGGAGFVLGFGGWLLYGGVDDPDDDDEPPPDDGGDALEDEEPVS
jgi:hypothetical protein